MVTVQRAARCAACLLAVLLLTSAQAHAQTTPYPTRQVTIVVTAAAGGVSDVLARAIGQRLSTLWQQPVVIENRGGGSHTVGAAMVAKAAPDGHTLMLAESGTYVTNPLVYEKGKLPFDVEKDIAPITGVARIHHALIVNRALPVETFAEFLDHARRNPGAVTYGTTGVASATHLNMVLLESVAGLRMTPIHYRGAAPAFTDVVAGHIASMLISTNTALQGFQEQKVKLLGIGSATRLAEQPTIPSLNEAQPGYQAGTWFGLATTAGTPADVVSKISKDVGDVLREPAFRERFLGPQLFEPIASSPAEFNAFLQSERKRWTEALRDAKIKIE